MTEPLDALARPLKQAIIGQVRALFNDGARGERPPVQRRPDGLFGPGSVAWRVHGDVTSMMVGGIAGLMLQMLHPAVLAGVWDHSKFRTDMHGRLRRTARFIALTTYGGRDEALSAIARVRAIHAHVGGTLPDGRPYQANDPALLAWVNVTEATSFLAGYMRYGEPRMSLADQDRYFAEMAVVAAALGADPVPSSAAQARALIAATRPALLVDARTREIARLVLNQPAAHRLAEPIQALTMQARRRPAARLGPPHARPAPARPATGPRRHAGHGAPRCAGPSPSRRAAPAATSRAAGTGNMIASSANGANRNGRMPR